jgi:hypothetical protein
MDGIINSLELYTVTKSSLVSCVDAIIDPMTIEAITIVGTSVLIFIDYLFIFLNYYLTVFVYIPASTLRW